MHGQPDRARLIAPPPLLGLAAIAAGFVTEHFRPLRFSPIPGVWQTAMGIGLIATAITMILSARRSFLAHGTTPNPYRPTAAIVVTGLYRLSRNPIYVAMLSFVLAFALIANSLWFIAWGAVFWMLLHFGVVKREETYLAAKFGDPYREYCRRVRRWI